ncbi:3895_t:CDS:1, partial [Cetraspora pellucida]
DMPYFVPFEVCVQCAKFKAINCTMYDNHVELHDIDPRRF